jgi:hypothetical protein
MNKRDNELWKQSLYDGDIAKSTIAHFADLIRADEREACAKVIEEYPEWLGVNAKRDIAAAIRARGNNV